MPKDRKCPVCREVMLVDQSLLDGTLCELYEKCPNKDYFYSYAYGHTEVVVGDQEFFTDHNSPAEEQRQFTYAMNAAIKELRDARAKDIETV